MPNYFIIGGDGKEYGPITEADIRLWISEGRLNAQTSARTDADTNWRPLGTFPGFAVPSQTPPTIAPPSSVSGNFSTGAGSTEYINRDYEIDIGGCISRGGSLFSGNFGTMFLTCLILIGIQIVFNFILGMFVTPVSKALMTAPAVVQVGFQYFQVFLECLITGPLIGGVYYVFLRLIRKQPTNAGDVFTGYQKAFGQLYLAALVIGLVVGACFLPFYYVWQAKAGPLFEQMQHLQSNPSALWDVFMQLLQTLINCSPILFVCFLPASFFSVCWLFTLPLVIDKQMSFSEAMRTSWKKVMEHWWQVFGLYILSSLISAIGLLACGVGVLFTAPIGFAALLLGYETIFGERKD